MNHNVAKFIGQEQAKGDDRRKHKVLQQLESSDVQVGDTINIANPYILVGFRVVRLEGKDLVIESFTFRVGLSDITCAVGYRYP